jgi:hypothetical protein
VETNPGTEEPEMPEGEQGEQGEQQGQQTPPATPSGGTNPDPGSTTGEDNSGASHGGVRQ